MSTRNIIYKIKRIPYVNSNLNALVYKFEYRRNFLSKYHKCSIVYFDGMIRIIENELGFYIYNKDCLKFEGAKGLSDSIVDIGSFYLCKKNND